MTVSEWADRHRFLSSRAASEAGPYRTSRTPDIKAIMDALSSSQVCIRAGVLRSTAWRRWAASLLTIAKHLNALDKSGRKAGAPKRAADKNVVKPDESGAGTLL